MGRDEWIFAAKLAAMAMVAVSVWLRSRPAAKLGFEGDSNGGGSDVRTKYRPGDKKVLKLTLTDAGGNPTDLAPAPVVWASSAADVVQTIAGPDGLSAVLSFLKPGEAEVTATSGPLAAKLGFSVGGGPAAALAFADDGETDAAPSPGPP